MQFSASLLLVLIFTIVTVAIPIPIPQETYTSDLDKPVDPSLSSSNTSDPNNPVDPSLGTSNTPDLGDPLEPSLGGYIDYNTLSKNNIPCSKRGSSAANCKSPAPSGNGYHRGCNKITRCRNAMEKRMKKDA